MQISANFSLKKNRFFDFRTGTFQICVDHNKPSRMKKMEQHSFVVYLENFDISTQMYVCSVLVLVLDVGAGVTIRCPS